MSDENVWRPDCPDDDGFDVREYIGNGYLFDEWLKRINEKDYHIQKERLQKYGKDVPDQIDGKRVVKSGYRYGCDYIPPALRSSGRKSRARDLTPRFTNSAFGIAEKKKFLAALEKLGSIISASAACGYSRHTIYLHANKDPKFKEAIEIYKARHNSSIRQKIIDRIHNGDEVRKYDAAGKLISREVKDVSSAILLKYIESSDEDFARKSSGGSMHLHIGSDNKSVNDKLQSLAARLGVSLPDKSGEDDEDIIDIN